MARLLVVTVLAVLAGLMAPVAAASADLGPMAVEEGGDQAPAEGGEQAPGREPRPPDASGNPAAPDPYDVPWTWGMSFLLLAGAGLLVLLVGGLYYLLVYRPERHKSEVA